MLEDRSELEKMDLAGLSEVLSEHLAVKDQEGHTVLQVAQLASVYFPDPFRREVKEAVVTCCEAYLQRCRQHLHWTLNPATGFPEPFGESQAANPRAWLPEVPEDEEFTLIYHGNPWKNGASPYSLETFGSERRPYLEFGYFRVSFPLLEFADGSGSLPEVLLDICRTLKPASGYAGIGLIDTQHSWTNIQYQPVVYDWAQRFPGLEVDYPLSHSIWLTTGREGRRDGIKGVNWLTVVGDRYLPELGGADKVEADLAALDSQFVVRRYDGGILIQAGPRPQLGDAARGVWPALYVKLARVLKPIRVTSHKPFQRGTAVVPFDAANSEAWLRRFDDK
jgi:hypothetical protein